MSYLDKNRGTGRTTTPKRRRTGRGDGVKVNVSLPRHLVKMAQVQHPHWPLSWLFQEAMAQWVERGCPDESMLVDGLSWDDLSSNL